MYCFILFFLKFSKPLVFKDFKTAKRGAFHRISQ